MWSSLLVLASALVPALAQTSSNSSVSTGNAYPLNEYTLTATGIIAKFIPYGARLTSLIVADRDGNMQDIALGYDNTTQYVVDTESE
jgi:aldose 1-epimerase